MSPDSINNLTEMIIQTCFIKALVTFVIFYNVQNVFTHRNGRAQNNKNNKK